MEDSSRKEGALSSVVSVGHHSVFTFLSSENVVPEEGKSLGQSHLELRYNLATKVMRNGVEVIVATERKPRPVEAEYLRHLSSTVTRPITLAPHTLTNLMSMVLPTDHTDDGQNHFISALHPTFLTRTYYTAYNYPTTLSLNNTTAVSIARTTITNTLTEPHNPTSPPQHINPTRPLTITLTASPTVTTHLLHTAYTYFNTFLDGDQPIVMSSTHTLSNTLIAPSPALEPSETFPATKTFFKTIGLTRTITDGTDSQVMTTKNVVTQVVVTDKGMKKEAEAEAETEVNIPVTTDVTKTYFVTYTYFSTYIEGDQTKVKSDVSVSSDVTIEKFYIKPKKTETVERTRKPETVGVYPFSVFATRTYEISGGESDNSVVELSTVTETIPLQDLPTEYLQRLNSSLYKITGALVTTATLKGGEKVKITAHRNGALSSSYAKYEIKPTKTILYETTASAEVEESSKPKPTFSKSSVSSSKSKISQKSKLKSSKTLIKEATAEALIGGKDETISPTPTVTFTPATIVPPSTSPSPEPTATPAEDTKKPPVKQSAGVNVTNLLNLNSLGMNGMNVLGPVFNAMAELIHNNLNKNTETLSRRNDTAAPEPEQVVKKPVSTNMNPLLNFVSKFTPTTAKVEPKVKATTPRAPVYIPVGSFAKDSEFGESQQSEVTLKGSQSWHEKWTDAHAKNFEKGRPHDPPITILEGGIPISPGQVITTNSDVIIGRPGESGPRPPTFAIKNNVPVDMKPPPPPHAQFSGEDEDGFVGQHSTNPVLDVSISQEEHILPPRPPLLPPKKRPFKNPPNPFRHKHPHVPKNSDYDSGVADLNPPPVPPPPVRSHDVHQVFTVNHEQEPEPPKSPELSIPLHLGANHNIENYINPGILHVQQQNLHVGVPDPTPLEHPNVVLIPTVPLNLVATESPVGVDRSTGQQLLVNIQPSQVANIVIPHGSSTAVIVSDGKQHSLKGEVIDDPSPHPEPVGFVGAEPVLKLETEDIGASYHNDVVPAAAGDQQSALLSNRPHLTTEVIKIRPKPGFVGQMGQEHVFGGEQEFSLLANHRPDHVHVEGQNHIKGNSIHVQHFTGDVTQMSQNYRKEPQNYFSQDISGNVQNQQKVHLAGVGGLENKFVHRPGPQRGGNGIYVDISPPGHLPPRPNLNLVHQIHSHDKQQIAVKEHLHHQSGHVHDVPLNAQVQLGSALKEENPLKEILISANSNNHDKVYGPTDAQNHIKRPLIELPENLSPPPLSKGSSYRIHRPFIHPHPVTPQRFPPHPHPTVPKPPEFMIPPPQPSHRPPHSPDHLPRPIIPIGAGGPQQNYPTPRPEDILIVPHKNRPGTFTNYVTGINNEVQQTVGIPSDLETSDTSDPIKTEYGEEIQESISRPLFPGQLPAELQKLNSSFGVHHNHKDADGLNIVGNKPKDVIEGDRTKTEISIHQQAGHEQKPQTGFSTINHAPFFTLIKKPSGFVSSVHSDSDQLSSNLANHNLERPTGVKTPVKGGGIRIHAVGPSALPSGFVKNENAVDHKRPSGHSGESVQQSNLITDNSNKQEVKPEEPSEKRKPTGTGIREEIEKVVADSNDIVFGVTKPDGPKFGGSNKQSSTSDLVVGGDVKESSGTEEFAGGEVNKETGTVSISTDVNKQTGNYGVAGGNKQSFGSTNFGGGNKQTIGAGHFGSNKQSSEVVNFGGNKQSSGAINFGGVGGNKQSSITTNFGVVGGNKQTTGTTNFGFGSNKQTSGTTFSGGQQTSATTNFGVVAGNKQTSGIPSFGVVEGNKQSSGSQHFAVGNKQSSEGTNHAVINLQKSPGRHEPHSGSNQKINSGLELEEAQSGPIQFDSSKVPVSYPIPGVHKGVKPPQRYPLSEIGGTQGIKPSKRPSGFTSPKKEEKPSVGFGTVDVVDIKKPPLKQPGGLNKVPSGFAYKNESEHSFSVISNHNYGNKTFFYEPKPASEDVHKPEDKWFSSFDNKPHRNISTPNKVLPADSDVHIALLSPPRAPDTRPKPEDVMGLSPPPLERPRRPQRPKPPFKFELPTAPNSTPPPIAIENDFPPVRSPEFNRKPIKPQDIFPPRLPDNFIHHLPEYPIRPQQRPVTSLPIDTPTEGNTEKVYSDINGHSKPITDDDSNLTAMRPPPLPSSTTRKTPPLPSTYQNPPKVRNTAATSSRQKTTPSVDISPTSTVTPQIKTTFHTKLTTLVTPTAEQKDWQYADIITGSETVFDPDKFSSYVTPTVQFFTTKKNIVTTLVSTGSTTIFGDLFTTKPVVEDKPSFDEKQIEATPTITAMHTTTFTVTTTMTTVVHSLGHKPSTKTIVLTKTLISTVFDKITETKTLLKPTTATIIQTHTIATTKTALVVPTALYPTHTKQYPAATLKPEIFVADPHAKDTITISVSSSMNKNKHGEEKPGKDSGYVLVSDKQSEDVEVMSEDDGKESRVVVGGVFDARDEEGMKEKRKEVECNPGCKGKRNELCQRVEGVMKCVCRPGFARMFPDRPCRPTYTYNVQLMLEKLGSEPIAHEKKQVSPNMAKLASATKEGLDRMIMQSELRDVYHGVMVNGFQGKEKKTMVDFYVQLSENTDEGKLMDILKKTLQTSNYSLGGTELFAARESGSLYAEDFNECLSSKFHDCSENARCFNLKGTYTCSCKEGFTDLSENAQFPGRVCSDTIGCEYCGYHGACYSRGEGQLTCECFQWYSGERCHINLKVLLIALVTIGAVLLALLLVCAVMTCLNRRSRGSTASRTNGSSAGYLRYRGPSSQSLDRRAMIADSSSESSVENLPYVCAPALASSEPGKKKPALRHTKGPAPRPLPPPGMEQRDRSVTVMIPRAKYRPMPPLSPHLTMSTFSPDKHLSKTAAQIATEQKLINYLDGNTREDRTLVGTIQTNRQAKEQQKTPSPNGGSSPKPEQKKESKIFEYEYKISNMLFTEETNSADKRSFKSLDDRFRRHSDSTHLHSDTSNRNQFRKYSAGALVSAGYEVSAKVGMHHLEDDTTEDDQSAIINSHTLKSSRSQFTTLNRTGDHKTMSEARSYDETTVHPPTRSLKTHYSGSSPSSRVNNDEGHTMIERDLGSTFIMPESQLFKPEADRGSDISNFDSL